MKKEVNKFMIFKIVAIVIIIGILIILYARFVGTKGLVVKEYAIKNETLDDKYDGFKIVHFTDVHFGSTYGVEEVKELVRKINDQNPDVIVFTGDLFEFNITISDDNLNALFEELNKLKANINIFAVPGNHDYDQKEYWDKAMEKLNWKFLVNTYEYVYNDTNTPIVFVGVDDYWIGDPNYKDAYSYLNENTKDYYTILLAHEPDQIDHLNDFTEDTNYTFNIALSGHSHNGQVRLPFIGAIYTPYGSKKYYDDHYVLDGKDLYISGGLGTSGYKLRWNNKPSFNIFRFYTK